MEKSYCFCEESGNILQCFHDGLHFSAYVFYVMLTHLLIVNIYSVQRMFVTSLFCSVLPTKILDMVKNVDVKCTQKTRGLMQRTEERSS